MNLAELIRQRTAANDAGVCFRIPNRLGQGGDELWSYSDLERAAARAAGVLHSRGLRPGDRVVVQAQKSPEVIALYLGALRAGVVFVPLNVSYTPPEVAFFVSDCSPSLLVVAPDTEDELAAACVDGIPLLTLGERGDGSFAAAMLEVTAFGEPVACGSGELAAIVYTSGTTGRSKGAMVTHGNLTSNALVLHQLWGFEPGDVLLHALPVFHVHGLFVALHTAFLNASEIHFLPRFEISAVLERLPRCTVMMGVPTFYVRLLKDPGFDSALASSIRLFVSGSAPLTEATFAEFEERSGHQILERYGMSEAGMITSNPLAGERLAGTVGYPLPGVSVRVCGEDDQEVGAGEVGVLQVRGPNLFAGYWQLEEKTDDEHRDGGWFVTGDLVTQSEDGRISIVGRGKDLVISGGYNIYPKEVEVVLDRVPGVAESAVIGVPHPDLGEGVVAILVPVGEPIEIELLERSLSAELARFKHPRRFHWVDSLPRNAMAKVQKQVLRERFADVYQL